MKTFARYLAVVFTFLFILYGSISYGQSQVPSTGDSTSKSGAEAVFEKLEKNNHFVNYLTSNDIIELPVGLNKTYGNTDVTIAISQVAFKPHEAEMTVFVRLRVPQREDPLYFAVGGVRMSMEGGLIGPGRAALLSNERLLLKCLGVDLVLKGGIDTSTGGVGNTFIGFDCNGITELGIAADIEFPRSWLVPVDKEGNRIANPAIKVRGSFKTQIDLKNNTANANVFDLLAEISLPDFELAKLPDFTFSIKDAIIDMSDVSSSERVVYPDGYISKYLPGSPDLWQGVFIGHADVKLPAMFSNRKSHQRTTIGATDMLIDRNGYTGQAYAKNLLEMGDLSASWPLSLDTVAFKLEAGQLLKASAQGRLKIPLSEADTLGYTAVAVPKNGGIDWSVTVKTVDTLAFNVFKANVELFPDSRLELNIVDNVWKPEALLNGRMWIGENKMIAKGADTVKGGQKLPMEFKGVEFKQLHLFTEAPYVSVAYFGYNDKLEWSGFPVYVSNIGLEVKEGETALAFTLGLSFEKFSAEAHLKVLGQLAKTDDFVKYQFKRVAVDSIAVNADIGPVAFKASLLYKQDDPEYGTGFGGAFDVNLKSFDVRFAGKGMYGTKPVDSTGLNGRFTYGFIDLKASIPGGVPFIHPALLLNGGAGAFYSKMKRSASGSLGFVPDQDGGWGFKLGVMFQMASGEDVMNGEAGLEGAFASKSGRNYISLYGIDRVMSKRPGGAANAGDKMAKKAEDINKKEAETTKGNAALANNLEKVKAEDPRKAASMVFPMDKPPGGDGITGLLGLQYDFTNNVFHGNLDMYINVAEGKIHGVGGNNAAGSAVLHIDAPNRKWYFYVGTPEQPVSLAVDVNPIGSAKVGFYFMVGTELPDAAPPPQEVTDVIGETDLDLNRDLATLKSGLGFAFGGFVQVQAKVVVFPVVADIKAGVGMDIMVKQYLGAHCDQTPGKPIGFHEGFYATGKVWAYIIANLQVGLGPVSVDVADVSIATLLQARFPNPAYLHGTLAVKLNVKCIGTKNIRFDASMGDNCTIVGTGEESPVGMPIIADNAPKEGTDASVFVAPQVTIKEAEGKILSGENAQGQRMFFRIRLREYSMEANGQKIPADISWDAPRTGVSLTSVNILPPRTTIKTYVKFGFEQSTDRNNWQPFYVNGREYAEDRTFTFLTGDAPDYIPLENISYTYPVINQRNLFRAESGQGYIRLKRGQPYLFTGSNRYEIQVLKGNELKATAAYTYDAGSRQVNYTIPAVMEPVTEYTFDWLSMDSTKANAPLEYQTSKISTGATEVETEYQKATAGIRQDGAHSILSYGFRTSRYDRFADKINALNTSPLVGRISSDAINLQLQASAYEAFDATDLNGSAYTSAEPLVTVMAVLDDPYFTGSIYPRLYTGNPLTEGVYITNRDTTVLGFKPAKALYISNSYLTALQNSPAAPGTQLPFVYDLPQTYKLDFIDLQNKVVNRFLGTSRQYEFEQLILGTYPFIRQGDYKVMYQYRLPGAPALSGFVVVKYYNPIK